MSHATLVISIIAAVYALWLIALCVSDPALNRALAEQFEADLEHARRITIEHLDAEHGLASTIRDHAMLPLRPLL